MVCRIHHYAHKETILKKAWKKGDVEFDGAQITIPPDLSRATPQWRAMLRLILEAARQSGITYRWGFPLSETFRKIQSFLTLHAKADIPALFTFIEITPITVPDWLQMIPRAAPRSFPPGTAEEHIT